MLVAFNLLLVFPLIYISIYISMNRKKRHILLLFVGTLILLFGCNKFETTEGFREQQRYRKLEFIPKELAKQPSIVIMGDGFTSADFNTYRAAAKQLEKYLFDPEEGVSPYNKTPFCDYFNIFTIFLNSQERGIGHDKPKNTIFRCYYVDQTNIVFDDINFFGGRKAPNPFSVAKQFVPGIDLNNTVVVILVNDKQTGYTTGFQNEAPYGNWISIISLCENSEEFKRLVLREVGGKAFAHLAQEDDNYTQERISLIKEMYDQYGFYSNIDFTDDPNEVKWKHFLSFKSIYPNLSIYSIGNCAYSPDLNNVMNRNGAFQYNAPSREAIIKRIYQIHGEGWEYTNSTFRYYFVNNQI